MRCIDCLCFWPLETQPPPPQRAPSSWGHFFDRAIGRLPARHCCASIAPCPETRSSAGSSPDCASPLESSPRNILSGSRKTDLTEIESWRHLQSDNIEFTMKRLREPIENMA